MDFIFVHGLDGVSTTTWSKTKSVTHYWPQEWLPKDPAIKNVRIPKLWVGFRPGERQRELFKNPSFWQIFARRDEHVTLPWHCKYPNCAYRIQYRRLGSQKFYMLARQSQAYQTLTDGFRALYFLAKPHRGCDSARLLNSALQISNSSRAYVADLERASGTIQPINEDFRDCSADIELWSFYETQKLTLGYPDEKQIPINAEHCSICKLETLGGASYLALRNAFASTIQYISKQGIAPV